ncbi:unnamed protein product [Symbiodinium sp. CCMP2592]|nr:unnamed protein product [Symbiodinium sp. CCMP2592]
MDGRLKLLKCNRDGSVGRHWSEDWSMVFRVGWTRVRDTWWTMLPTILEDEELGAQYDKLGMKRVFVPLRCAKYTTKKQRTDYEKVGRKRPHAGAEGEPCRILQQTAPLQGAERKYVAV